jgi:hypothetical protein
MRVSRLLVGRFIGNDAAQPHNLKGDRTMTANNSIFAGFESSEDETSSGTQLVYGVNVLRVEAEASVTPSGKTAAELVAQYREVLGLPTEVAVFVDGVKWESDRQVPATAQRIEIIKPAGKKGAVYLDQLPQIGLADEDAVLIQIYRADTLRYEELHEEPKGQISASLLGLIGLNGYEVLGRDGDSITIGARSMETKHTRRVLRLEAQTRRRAGELWINDIRAGLKERPVAIFYNGEQIGNTVCELLVPGDKLVVILTGREVAAEYSVWLEEMRDHAHEAYVQAVVEREHQLAEFSAELERSGFVALRKFASEKGLNAWGKGRTGPVLRTELLAQEFPELPDEETFVSAWLNEHAPDAL